MTCGSQGVKCKGHDEISWNCNLCHCLQLNEALRPGFGQWDSNLSNVWSERSMVSPTLGARHVFSIRIYMLYVYTQYIMWLEGALNLCVYHSSLTRWQELMCWSNLNMVQCINFWRCFLATSNSWKCQAIWGRSSELSASQRIQRISIVRTFNMCSLHVSCDGVNFKGGSDRHWPDEECCICIADWCPMLIWLNGYERYN